MKYMMFFCILLLSPYAFLLSSEFPTNGIFTAQVPQISSTTYSKLPLIFQEDRQDYINGGLIFTYNSLWLTIPRVWVTVELVNPASPTDTYVAVISSNSAASTTVMVYKISNGGGVVEASSGEVKVSMLAIQNIY